MISALARHKVRIALHTGEANLRLGDYYGSEVNRCASLRQLATLASKSFLTANAKSGRYADHELLRQYGEAALREDGGRYEATREAHAHFSNSISISLHSTLPSLLFARHADTNLDLILTPGLKCSRVTRTQLDAVRSHAAGDTQERVEVSYIDLCCPVEQSARW